jgi:cephalosporin hydroxylase
LESNFEQEKRENIRRLGRDEQLRHASTTWIRDASRYQYSYHFTWLGRPIIQFPQDIVAMQEIVWRVRPDLIIETGIAHGGSLIFYASILELVGGEGRVLGIDVDIRAHNRVEIERHPMCKRISMVQGSSIEPAIIEQVRQMAMNFKRILVVLDSNHLHSHVLEELNLYSPFVRKDSYLVVFDTVVEDMPENFFPDRPWCKGNNPKSAVREFLKTNDRFIVDGEIEDKLLITVAPGGYLRCVKD